MNCRNVRPAFTLVELVVSVSVMSILMLAIGSTMVLATRAVPGNDSTAAVDKMLAASQAIDQITAELLYALTITEQTQTSITFTVADRDADAVSETIRYAWSGSTGDPLTREYNGSAAVNMIDDVQEFELVYTLAPGEPGSQLLMVVSNTTTTDPDDVAKIDMFESWAYEATLIQHNQSASDFAAAVAGADVAYVSETVNAAPLSNKLTTAPIGVVSEERFLDDNMEVSTQSGGSYVGTDIFVIDNSHYITALLDNGSLTVASSTGTLIRHRPTLAVGVQLLAMDEGTIDAAFVVVETGSTLVDASAAAGPRVFLPWGFDGYDFDQLNGNALALLKRALDWASSSRELVNVQIGLAVGQNPTHRTETQAQLLNRPEV